MATPTYQDLSYGSQADMNRFYNPSANAAGVRETGNTPAGQPIYSPIAGSAPFAPPATPQTGGTSSQPVITAQAAQADAAQKFTTFQNLQSQVKNQQSVLAQQAAQKAADDANKQYQDAQTKVQQTQLQQKQQEIDAKNQALGLASGPVSSNTTTPDTGISSNPSAPNAPQTSPSPQSSADTANQGIQTATNQYAQGLNNIQTQKDQLTDQILGQIQSLASGTIPLSAPQQALLNSLQSQLQQNVQEQTVANQSYVGSVQEAQFRSGGEYTPEQMSGNIQNAVSVGVAKIQALDNSAAVTMANLEQQFQTQNYDEINKSYDLLSKQLDDKATALTDTYKAVTSALQDQRDFQYKQQQDAIANDLAVKKYKLDVSNSAVDNDLKRAQIAKVYSDMSPTDLSSVKSWVSDIKTGSAKLTDVPDALKNAVASGLANSGGNSTTDLLTTTKASLDSLNAMVTNNQGFTGAVGAKGISSLFGLKGQPFAGSQAENFDAKLKQTVNDVVLPNLTILHGLGRVTDREFQALQSSITDLSPNLSEGEFKKELGTITDTINAKIAEGKNGVVGENIQSATNAGYTPTEIVNEYLKDPTMSDKIKAARTAGYTDQDIVNYYTSQ